MLNRHNYRPRSGVTGAFNCRPITGGKGFSLHAFDPDGFFTFWSDVRVTKAVAVDINWDENPYGPVLKTDMPEAMILDIERIKTKSGKQVWRWGGRYSGNKDAMHFEVIVSPADLATGVVIPGVVHPTPQPTPVEEPQVIYHIENSPYTFLQKDEGMMPLTKDEFWTFAGAGMPVKTVTNEKFKTMNKLLHDLAKRPLQPV